MKEKWFAVRFPLSVPTLPRPRSAASQQPAGWPISRVVYSARTVDPASRSAEIPRHPTAPSQRSGRFVGPSPRARNDICPPPENGEEPLPERRASFAAPVLGSRRNPVSR